MAARKVQRVKPRHMSVPWVLPVMEPKTECYGGKLCDQCNPVPSDERLREVAKEVSYALGCPCADMTDEEYDKLTDEQVDEIGNKKAIAILKKLIEEATTPPVS